MTAQRITRVESDGRALVWHCSTCDKPVQHGHGWVELVGEQMRAAYERMQAVDDLNARQRSGRITSAADYYDLPAPARWRATCRVCNGDDAGSGYFIEVDEISTVAAVLDWSAHLAGKIWTEHTDWDDVCRLVAAVATRRAAA